ncbi:MAG: zinc-dependent peptidase [Nitrosomonas sp.]|nr:zinc-dependent peptidase [Nitrosomonas sp.]
MSWRLKNWQRERILKHDLIPPGLWQKMLMRLKFLDGLSPDEMSRLQQYVILFLHHKQISGAHDLIITEEMRVMIAVQACILILELDLDYYDNWVEIIVYPGKFIIDYDYSDENGIVHHARHIVSGESWLAGPVILSWQDVAEAGVEPGYNVVIHEFAHKLDMLHEGANGCPMLHANMSAQAWHDIFSRAYASFCQQVDLGEETIIDPYAAESPAEFFAVVSEVFFTLPLAIKQNFPSVYEQLALFYRQDPANRWINR